MRFERNAEGGLLLVLGEGETTVRATRLPCPPEWDRLPLMSETLSAALAATTLPDTEGHLVRLGSLWEEGPAVVVFLRHYG